MIAGLVPIKRLGAGKSRLLAGFPPDLVTRLQGAMLEDVVGALRATRGLAQVTVVTEDPAAAALARRAGAASLLHPAPGLNPSLEAATAALASAGAEAVLIVLADVAGAESADLEALLTALDELGGRGVVIAPARDGGTAALLRAPPDAVACAFGPDSGGRHRALAEASGLPWRELRRPSLEIDLDRPEDVAALRTRKGGAPRTRALLRASQAEAG